MARALPLVVLALVLALPAAAQETTPEPSQRQFTLSLAPLLSPRWDASRELRLALWDSPMSRLELAAATSMWAARHNGPIGIVPPPAHLEMPVRLNLVSGPQLGLFGPWSKGWDALTWQEKVGAGAQTGLMLFVGIKAVQAAF